MLDAARRQKTLKNAEESLRRELKLQTNSEKISVAPEKVRSAKISLFKGQREIAKYIEDPNQSEINHLQKLDEREKEWKEKSIEKIIRIYE